MKKILTLCVVLCLSYLSMGATNPKHEFRATWLATVSGIDWPKTKATNDATREQQKQELIDIFDQMKAGNMNAVCFQVRSLCDAMYQSSYEPWSVALTGTRGKDPSYDPLQFAIDEAHKRGMELHVWVNPFRASTSTLAATDMLWDNAGDWLIKYNNSSFSGYLIDPGYPESRAYVVKVLMEIINNYDVDGLVMDDYFYAYGGTTNQDSVAQALHYRASEVIDVNNNGNKIDDWRRSNVDNVIKAMYDSIQVVKPWVRFGMGPGGIWTTDSKAASAYGISLPSGISGSDIYNVLYCNTVEWIKGGYVDYVNPQIYWSTQVAAQDYDVLCQWWSTSVCEHFSNQLPNQKRVHHFPSLATYKAIQKNDGTYYSGYSDGYVEIQRELDANRKNLSSGYTGAVFYNTTSYLQMSEELAESHFTHTALAPPMEWKVKGNLAAPTNLQLSGTTLSWQHPTAERFTVYAYPKGTAWSTAKNDPAYLQGVIYGNSMDISGIDTNANDIAVCAYDRYGVEHTAAVYSNDSGAGTTPNPETIIWELNGGEVNTVTVEVPSLTTLEAQFKNDYNSYFGASVATTREITNFLYYGSKEEGGSNLVYNMMNDPASDWTWLRDYIISKSASNTTIQTALLAGTDAHWRYSIVAFLTASAGTNSTYTVDFSIAGQLSKWGTAYQIAHGAVLLPTYVTSAFTLPIPTHPEGHDFLGWYDNAEFIGSPLTTISADWTGSLYAKWHIIDPTWQITYTSTDGNIITPRDTTGFGANIVSNTYDDGQGIIVFDGPVMSIGDYAFQHCSFLTNIAIPNSVTSIGESAFFNCTSLTNIAIPNSVTSIGDSAFYVCSDMASITIPNSVTSIGEWAFSGCTSLTSITIPESVTSIGNNAFTYCDKLNTMVVEEGNTKYDSRNNCNAIIETATNTLIAGCQNTTIPNSVTSIGERAFSGCTSLTSITIPNSVTSIGERAFSGCTSITSITIPNSVTSIERWAFSGCTSLTSITIPNSVTSIGYAAFRYCPSLTSMVVEPGNTTYDSRNNCNAIIETATNTLIAGCQNTTIPNSVTSIGYAAFYACTSLTSITIPNSVTSIERWAFHQCTSLTSITIPNSVTSIGNEAFWRCRSLTSITIPNSVTSIGYEAFWGCSSLDTIHLEATTPPALGSDVFEDTPSPVCIIPCGTLAAYQASDWAGQVSSFVEDCPPASAAITYVLNGGVQSEWETPQTMYNELNAVWNAFSGTSKTWGNLEDLKANVANGIPTQAGTMALDFITDENFKAKFEWLVTYMDAKCTEQGQTLPSSNASFLRYNLQAFFIDGMRTSWPISADYTICGVSTVEAYQPYWKSGFANPTNPTEEFVLNAPYKEGYTFAGWYTNADFSGEKVTTINSETTGTLYAKWVEYIPTIAEVWNMEEGVETKISGVVNWVRYGNVFIQDITGGFRVYIPNDSTRLIPEVGTKIIAKGVRGSFAGSPQLNDAVIESSEPATLADPVVTTLEDLCANPLKYFGQRVFVEVVYVAEYDTYGNIYVAERDGSNKVKGHYMVVDPIAFPVGTKVSITAVASQYDGAFQFEGDIAGIELAPGPKRDTYEYPVRNEKYTLTNDWVISNIEGNFAANKLAPTDSWFVRGMAAKDGIMYFINRETQSLIRVDGATGHMLDPIKITGEHLFEVYDEEMGEWKSDVIYGYNDIKFDQAGNCLIGACTTGGATRCQTFFIYIVDLETGVCTKLIEDVLWDNPSLDQVQFRFDAFGAAGDVTKNGVVMAADAQSWNVYRWLIKNGVVGDGEQINCALNAEIDESLFIETENFGTAPQIFPQDELGELFYVDGASTLPMLFDGDGMLLDDFINVPTGRNVWNNYGDTISINSGHLNGLIEFQVGEEYFLLMAATYSTHNVPSTFALYKFADENRAFSGMEPLWYFPHNGMGSNTNGYRTAVPSVDIIDNNTAKLYLYVGENGYACYTLNVGDKTVEPIDPTWQITYTSSNDSIVTPYATDVFGANIVSNTYENGVGTITFDGPVTSIGNNAFYECSSLTSIIIPNSITSIGDRAFQWCDGLTSITIPDSVTSIGEYAFRICDGLTSITIPNSVTSIRSTAFSHCKSIVSMVVADANAVYDSRNGCNAIIETATNTLVAGCQNTIIPNSVTKIGESAFNCCYGLTSIAIPNSVTEIGGDAFSYCSSLSSVTIPNSVTSIGSFAFGFCINLASVFIPNSITNIESTTFYSCTSLTSITIPNSVTHIGHQAFLNCTSLTTIHVEATTPPALEDSTVFMNTPSPICVIPCGTLAAYQASDWASQVSEFVEEGCVPIQMCGDDLYWEYADGVLTITGTGDMYDYADDKTGPAPWYDVRGSITTINMPNEMTKIGDYAFYKCTEVTSINMPTTLTAIGEKAFAQDTKLACEIILPASMTTIASRAFFNCQAVTAFHIEATTPPTIPNDAFERTTAPIHVPCGYGHVYGKHAQWGELNLEMCELLQDNVYYYPIDGHTARAVTYYSNPTDTIVIPSAVVIDGMPRTVIEVAASAFADCKDIPAIIFNEGLEYIGERAFVRCYGLQGTIVLPATLETIGERAFSYCDNVEKYLIQAMTPPALGANAFTGDNKNALFYISCEAMDDYTVATNWSSLKSRLRDACLNIYHYNTALGTNGVYTTEDTLVASIYYRRQFTTSRWETLYLPFEVDRVTVLEDGVEYDLNAWSIFSGGHYYLAKPYGIENKEVVFGFTQVVDAHTPYIIQFKEPYYHDKIITFHGKESWNKLNTSFEALPISFEMQMAGNTTLQDQILEEPVYMLRATSNFILQNTTTTLHPFECYVIPYATSSGAPARMSVRFRGDVPTAVESVKGNESHLTYTVDGYTLTVYPQGQAFSIYSLNGALIYSCEAGKEAVDCELNSGCYLLHAGAEAHKIML